MAKKLTHVNRAMTEDERRRANDIRAAAQKDFPPKSAVGQDVPPSGIPARVCDARKARRLTRYALGQLAGVGSVAVRDIEQGNDVPLSQLQAVAAVLGLAVELVDQTT
jgi:DNA-binding XRE family transcriptional regulator